MFVFPLGLGTKLRRWPVATLAIASLWVLVMVLDRTSEQITDRLLLSSARLGVPDVSRDLFVQYCRSRAGDPKACRRYALLVRTGFPGKDALKDKRHPSARWIQSPKTRGAMAREYELAEKIRRELTDCRASRKCFVYKDIIWRFHERQRTNPAELAGLTAYPTYLRAMSAYRRDVVNLCRDKDCLVSSNINVSSIFMAQLRHGGVGHLLGNLLFFVIFGIYVEQRTRRLLYVAAVVGGGTLGMFVHARFFGSADTMVLGGSANVSAVMGMFYVFFFHKKMRLQVWLPRRLYVGTPFYAEVKYCFPLIFVLSDVSGGFDSGFSSLLTARVAHFAHLSGFAFGVAAGLIIAFVWRLPRAFMYEDEVQEFRDLEASRSMDEVLDRAGMILEYNPDNVHAMEVGCGAFLRWVPTADRVATPQLFDRGRTFLATYLQSVCAINVRDGAYAYVSRMLGMVPVYMPMRIYLGKLGQVSALKIGDYALAHGDPLLALRVYDFYLSRYQMALKSSAVEETAGNILAALNPTPENVGALRAFHSHHPESLLAPRIAAWLGDAAQGDAA